MIRYVSDLHLHVGQHVRGFSPPHGRDHTQGSRQMICATDYVVSVLCYMICDLC